MHFADNATYGLRIRCKCIGLPLQKNMNPVALSEGPTQKIGKGAWCHILSRMC